MREFLLTLINNLVETSSVAVSYRDTSHTAVMYGCLNNENVIRAEYDNNGDLYSVQAVGCTEVIYV